MAARKGKPPRRSKPAVRAGRGQQRQRLIEACISALHQYGPSRTTVEKVVAIARMSPGIVRFYFDSKAAMLVASLQFLAGEFEERVLVPVARLKSDPVAALDLLIDLYLDPDIASPRKVSVWYAFWGEASSRQEYYEICGQKDQSFAALVRDLIGRLVAQSPPPAPDPDAVALGLIGSLEMLWQEFAFQDESAIDRPAAKRRCRAYLRSIFPGRFAAAAAPAGRGPAGAPTFREGLDLFRGEWQLLGLASALARTGDFLTARIGGEHVIAVRLADGSVQALRNCCPRLPHALVEAPAGRADGWSCEAHGLRFALDGAGLGAADCPDLPRLDCLTTNGLILCRSRGPADAGAPAWRDVAAGGPLRPLGPPGEVRIAADWRMLVSHWLSREPAGAPFSILAAADGTQVGIEWTTGRAPDGGGWTGRALGRLSAARQRPATRRRFIAPNHGIEWREDGMTILQVEPEAPGRSVLKQWQLTACADERAARAANYLVRRADGLERRASRALAASAQQGVERFGYPIAERPAAAVGWFQDWLRERWPPAAAGR